jgi:hypothetical protein
MNKIIKTMLAITFILGMAGQTKAQNMNKVPTIRLSNGVEMPQLGVGTFLVTGKDAPGKISYALRHGYRLIDTAQAYGNEKEVGEGIKASGVERDSIFVTSKISPDAMRGGAEAVRESIERSLADLGTGYIDLMLIHWPVAGKIRETWQIMEEFVDSGKIRSIGLSNFNPSHIDEVLSFARIRPVLNQIEIHPYMTQFNVSGYNFRNGIQTEAWGPLGQGVTDELEDPAILEIAKRHNKSAAQVILRWHIQRGLITMPRCDNPEYVRENAAIFDFELSSAEMEIISGLNRNQRTNEKNDPDNFPW